jgi:hypothetical protein
MDQSAPYGWNWGRSGVHASWLQALPHWLLELSKIPDLLR